MTTFEKISEEFKDYPIVIIKLDNKQEMKLLDSNFDVQFSNNISYPEMILGFQHFIHATKDKMEITEKFSNRKKVYLVTSLFEKNIDHKEKTDTDVLFTSINDGSQKFINNINKNFPSILNRAFYKLWEMIVMFDLIPNDEKFTSAHLAEGPGSFIQATILYRELQEKLKKLKVLKMINIML